MDIWKFYDITHRKHTLMNPMSPHRFETLCKLLELKPGSRVLDMACGKGEFIVRLAELYGASGTGVDISPYFIKECLAKKERRVPASDLKFIEMDGSEFKPDPSEPYDLAICLGATWIYGDFRRTAHSMGSMVKAGGLVIIGDAFWQGDPPEDYLKETGAKREDFAHDYRDNIDIGEEEGLAPLFNMVSSKDDWDLYETLKWWCADDYARYNPGDSDVPELLERDRKGRELYLKLERDIVGWCIYVFRKK